MNIADATAKPISTILTSAFYKIPKFQRRFVWSQKEILQLLKDIEENDEGYFIGSMVAYKLTNDGTEKGIVDGQQRLTTISIVLCALRDIFNEKSLNDLALGLNSNYIQSPDRSNVQKFKLDTESSRPYFQNRILSFPKQFNEDIQAGSEEEMVLEKAYKIVKRYLNNGISANGDCDDYLTSFRDKILGLKIVYIELENKDDAYVIFDTLNDRGKSLALSDKVKSYLFRILKTEHADISRHSDYWNEIQEKINTVYQNLNLDDYIRYQWISRHGYCTEPQVYEKLKKIVAPINKDGAQEYLTSLKDDIDYFLFIHSPENRNLGFIGRDNIDKIKDSLSALNLFKIKQTISVLISLIRVYKDEKVSLRNFKKFLQYIENFHFRFNTIYSGRPSVFQRTYYTLAKNLSNNALGDKNSLFNNFKFDESKLPANEILATNFSKRIYTKNKNQDKKLIQYILRKIDQDERNGSISINYSQMTIEHLIPQSKIPTYGDNAIGQIGNLILATPEVQARLDDKPLKEKIDILRSENYPLLLFGDIPSEINESDELEIINARTKNMSKFAFENIWVL